MIITCVTFFALFTSTAFADTATSELPTTEQQLATWIAGTEWKSVQPTKGQEIRIIRRFYSDGTMRIQKDVSKWTEGAPSSKVKYQITSANTLEFGPLRWTAVLSADFEKYTATSPIARRTVTAQLIGRFQD